MASDGYYLCWDEDKTTANTWLLCECRAMSEFLDIIFGFVIQYVLIPFFFIAMGFAVGLFCYGLCCAFRYLKNRKDMS